eukprot:1867990-Prymnesium_polylepis.1
MSAAPPTARIPCWWAASKMKEALRILTGAIARLGKPDHATLLVKHSSMARNRSAVFAQVFEFLGLGASWAAVQASVASTHRQKAIKKELARAGGRQNAINYRGGVVGSARYASRYSAKTRQMLYMQMLEHPAVIQLFLPAGRTADDECVRPGHGPGTTSTRIGGSRSNGQKEVTSPRVQVELCEHD